jgi:hypothetical protein
MGMDIGIDLNIDIEMDKDMAPWPPYSDLDYE